MRTHKYNLFELRNIRETWKDMPIEAIPEKQREQFVMRKLAVDMYIDGSNSIEIEGKTGVFHNNIPRLIERCTTLNEFGEYYGYEALLSNRRIISSDKGTQNREFGLLLSTYPELKSFIEGCWYGDKKYTLEKNMNTKTLHMRFLKKCLELGVPDYEYPFNTDTKAYVSLTKYVKDLDKNNIKKAASRESKDICQKIMSTGYGTRYSNNPIAPFSAVQIDGHIIDMIYNIELLHEDGTIERKIATRAWLIAVIDVATRCILGYSISQEFNYNQYDVLEAVQNSIIPHKRPVITIDGLRYPNNGGYYSEVYPELKYALFDTVMLDNAKSHLAQNTMNKLIDQLYCSVNYGSVATPETRGIIERFFGTLETRGFHKLPSTTGSNIRDLKRKNPEKAAVNYDVTLEEIIQLMDVLIAEYNTTPHSGIENLTPLECLKRRVLENGMYPTIADDETIKNIEKLNYIIDTRIVRGGTKVSGRRPYINYQGTEYRCSELSVNEEYIGETITLYINPRDISELEAYSSKGYFIGVLRARGEYGTRSHSLKTRKNAQKLARERGRDKLEFDTPVTAYEQTLRKKGETSKRDATKADIVRRESYRKKPSDITTVDHDEEKIVPIKSKFTNTDIRDPEEFYKLVWGSNKKG